MRRHLPGQTDRIHRGSSFHPSDVGLQQWKQTQPFRSTACRLFMPQYSISGSGWRSRLSPGPCPGRISHPEWNDDPGRFSRTWDLIQIDQKDSKYFFWFWIITHFFYFLWFDSKNGISYSSLMHDIIYVQSKSQMMWSFNYCPGWMNWWTKNWILSWLP